MKVKKVLQIINKLQAVLEYYQEYTIKEMLDDIYSRCCVEGREKVVPVVEKETIPSAESTEMKKAEDLLLLDKNDLPSPEQVVSILHDISEDDLRIVLDRYTKKDLYTMVKLLNIKGHSNSNKDKLVAVLVERAQKPLTLIEKEAAAGDQALSDRKSAKKTIRDKSRTKLALQEAAGLIPEMEKEEAIAFLEKFTRSELLEIAGLLNLSVSRMATKNNMILMIVNHFSYIKLHQQMSQRRR